MTSSETPKPKLPRGWAWAGGGERLWLVDGTGVRRAEVYRDVGQSVGWSARAVPSKAMITAEPLASFKDAVDAVILAAREL